MTNSELLVDNGYEDVVVFDNPSFEGALIGVSESNCAIYDYELMVEAMMRDEGVTAEEAMEWIDYNTIRALPYTQNAPIILFPLVKM